MTGDDLQRRITEAAAAAGVPASRVSTEVLLLLPPDFVAAYEELFHKALRLPTSPQAGTVRAGELGAARRGQPMPNSIRGGGRLSTSVEVSAAPNVKGGAGKSRGGWVVGDEQALELKALTDRKLRRIARELRTALSPAGTSRSAGRPVRCAGCGRNRPVDDNFCSHCGRNLKEEG